MKAIGWTGNVLAKGPGVDIREKYMKEAGSVAKLKAKVQCTGLTETSIKVTGLSARNMAEEVTFSMMGAPMLVVL